MVDVLIVGGGVFGVTAALELRRRGHSVGLVDRGPIPHPHAASTDTSKAVRMDYGTDAFYVELAERAIEIWRAWNRHWGQTLYHEVGMLLLTREPMTETSFEGASFDLLTRRGLPLVRLDRQRLAARFPAWRSAPYVDGYFNPCGGWVESGAVMLRLIAEARAAGVALHLGQVLHALERGSRVTGAVLADGRVLQAETLVVAGGAWTPELLPHAGQVMRATAQPVLYFAPADSGRFAGERFPVWCADISRTGWYGFPLTAQGLVKIGNHGPGRRYSPGDPLTVSQGEAARCSGFASRTFPDLAGAPVRDSRLCLYCDTADGDFWIDRDPDRPGLVLAAGDSGHAFKFAPVLGSIIADVMEGHENPHARRFARRAAAVGSEQARHTEEPGGP